MMSPGPDHVADSADATPVFAEPWHARVFALAVQLNSAGHLDWSVWAGALSTEIASGPTSRDTDRIGADPHERESTYYGHWLDALEQVTRALDLVSDDERARAHEAWSEASRTTTHGEPLEPDLSTVVP